MVHLAPLTHSWPADLFGGGANINRKNARNRIQWRSYVCAIYYHECAYVWRSRNALALGACAWQPSKQRTFWRKCMENVTPSCRLSLNGGPPGQNLVWRLTILEFSKKRYTWPCSDRWTSVNNSEVSLFESLIFKTWHRNSDFCLLLEVVDIRSRFWLNRIKTYVNCVRAQSFINCASNTIP